MPQGYFRMSPCHLGALELSWCNASLLGIRRQRRGRGRRGCRRRRRRCLRDFSRSCDRQKVAGETRETWISQTDRHHCHHRYDDDAMASMRTLPPPLEPHHRYDDDAMSSMRPLPPPPKQIATTVTTDTTTMPLRHGYDVVLCPRQQRVPPSAPSPELAPAQTPWRTHC